MTASLGRWRMHRLGMSHSLLGCKEAPCVVAGSFFTFAFDAACMARAIFWLAIPPCNGFKRQR